MVVPNEKYTDVKQMLFVYFIYYYEFDSFLITFTRFIIN